MKKDRRAPDEPIVRLAVLFIGWSGIFLVSSICVALIRGESMVDGAVYGLAGSLFGFLGGMIMPRPDGQRQSVTIDQPANDPIPTTDETPQSNQEEHDGQN